MVVLAPAVPWALEGIGAAGAAAWAWATSTTGLTVLGTTTVVVGGAAVVKKVNEKSDAESATGGPDPCPTCKKNKERCQSLDNRMKGVIKELDVKRAPDIINNPGNLPWVAQGLPRNSIQGHIDIFDGLQKKLQEYIEEYEAKKCGELPKGAYEAALRDSPRPADPASISHWGMH